MKLRHRENVLTLRREFEMTITQAGDRKTFETLNGMRGIAALAVATMHIQWFLGPLHPAIVSVVVDFFFVLSGFVIAYSYEAELVNGYPRRSFLLARLIRLYPLFFLGLLLGAISKAIFEFPDNPVVYWGNVGFNLFMLPYPLPYPQQYDDLYPLNYPAWSIFYEGIAYILFALLIRRLTDRWLVCVILAGLAALIYTGIVEGTLDRGTWRPSVIGGLARVTFSFFAGVALHRLWLRRPTKWALHPVLLFALLIVPLLWRPDAVAVWGWLYELLVIAVWMPMMVWLGAGSTAKGRWHKICAVLGVVSYPLYILHATVYPYVFHYNDPDSPVFFEQHAPWPALSVILLLCLASWLLAVYVDLPFRRRLIRALLPQRSPQPAKNENAMEGDPEIRS
ncbi:acyltransferase family protein [Qipengyuania soli]|uniref:Acyltransferase n=1 Tax=Qipengyuania soli TaxID=2782568 RepID=A0A7S8F5K1_9SPHN|nr:acyltransferase [Qipengyuania soli]QPC99629.1 acyltransferase [Qipengyuania soli]